MTKEPITILVDKSIAEKFESVRAVCAERVHLQTKDGRRYPQKAIAADMDLSPTDLSRKLSGNPEDRRAWSTDDAEKYMELTGDTSPAEHWAAKYLYKGDRERILKQIEDLKALVAEE